MRLVYIMLLAMFISTILFSQSKQPSIDKQEAEALLYSGSFYDLARAVEKDYDIRFGDKGDRGGSGYKPFKRTEWFWKSRLMEDGSLPSTAFLSKKFDNYSEMIRDETSKRAANLKNDGMVWEPLGPVGIPQYSQSIGRIGNGRANVIAIDPSDDDVLWLGAAGGGVWKSVNGGQSWEQQRYDDFLALSVSHIAIDPNNSNTVYVATGDINTAIIINGNVQGGTTYSLPSIGVLKTTDGGKTWNTTGYNNSNQPIGSTGLDFVSTIIVHPDNSNRVILGTDDGLYESTNGGASFNRIANGTFRDIKLNPVDRNILHCALNNSNNFRYNLVNFDLSSKSLSGNSFSISNCWRAELAVSADQNGNYVYAVGGRVDGRMTGFYRSTDKGLNWTRLSTGSRDYLVRDVNGNPADNGQSSYDLAIEVNPNDKDEIYVGGINIWKSSNGGDNFSITAFWTHQYEGQGIDDIHADVHYLKYNPQGTKVYATTDGGLSVSSNKGTTWDDVTGNINTSQFYDVSVDNSGGDLWVLGGTQDNGTSLERGQGWRTIVGGDGMRTQLALDDNYLYASNPNGYLLRISLATSASSYIGGPQTGLQQGERGEWVTPFVVSPHDPKVIYAGYTNLWRSSDRGSSWTRLTNHNIGEIDDVVVSPDDPNTIYYCISGNSSYIFKTDNGGSSWSTLSTSGSTVSGYVKDLAVRPGDPNTLYYSVGGFSSDNKVWQVSGSSFKNLSSGLPNFAVNALYIDEQRNRVFAGTDVGVYVKEGSSSFAPFKNEMPNCIITDFESPSGNTELYAATYGSGIWVSPLLDCSDLETPEVEVLGNTMICPGDSVELKFTGSGNIEWSNGKKTRSIWVKEAGRYFVTKTDSKGCSATSEAVDIEDSGLSTPLINVPDDGEFCKGDSIRLIAGGGFFDHYFWNGVEGERIFYASEPGDYSVTVMNDDSECESTSETVTVVQNLPPNTPVVTYDNGILTSSFGNRYQWFVNDELIDGAEGKTYKPLMDGLYSVEVYTVSGCGAISDQFLVDDTSVEELTLTSSVVFPNPSSGSFTIKNLPVDFGMELLIYSLDGKLVYTGSDIANGVSLDLSLPSAKYIMRFVGNGVIYTTNLTIE